nr:peptidase S41 family protein [Tanacetum cinerariifolium]
MDTLCKPSLDLSNPCTISSIYSKKHHKNTLVLCYNKYRFSSTSVGGKHSRCKGLIVAQRLPKTKVSSQVGSDDESGESNRKLVKSIA